jgi:hypothetical protein
MSFTRLPTQLWMMVPKHEREIIAEGLSLSRTGISEIRDQEIISDGYSNDDLANVTEAVMLDWVGGSDDKNFNRLWELTVAKAHFIAHPPIGVITPKKEEEEIIVIEEEVETPVITVPLLPRAGYESTPKKKK